MKRKLSTINLYVIHVNLSCTRVICFGNFVGANENKKRKDFCQSVSIFWRKTWLETLTGVFILLGH